jgi:hypothetical protein
VQVVVWLLLGEQETPPVDVQSTGLNRQLLDGTGRLAVAVKMPAHVVDVWAFTNTAGVVKFMSRQPFTLIDPGEDAPAKVAGLV